MAIIGMSFHSIEGRKEKVQEKKSEMKVNSVPRIVDVKEVTIPTISKKVLSLAFEFRTTYDPAIGDIRIEGELLYLSDRNKEIMKQWEKDKKLPEKESLEILNYLFRRCLLKVANIAEDLQLPAPLPMPTIKPKK